MQALEPRAKEEEPPRLDPRCGAWRERVRDCSCAAADAEGGCCGGGPSGGGGGSGGGSPSGEGRWGGGEAGQRVRQYRAPP